MTIHEDVVNPVSGGTRPQEYRTVKVVDIQPDTVLDFDTYVYLPTNGKHVLFSRKTEDLKPEQVQRLKNNKITSLSVPLDQMPKFYEYSAKTLAALHSNQEISETERQERLRDAVRGLLTGVVGNSKKDGASDSGKDFLADCTQIVEQFVLKSPSKGVYKKILTLVGDFPDNYSHSANTSTFAFMFAIGLGLKNPEHCAVAGLLHDLGLSTVPTGIQNKLEGEWTSAEKETYQMHINAGLDLIKAQKMILPDAVLKAISQHHERFNSTGYPKGIPGSKICMEAQILAIADRFDEMTCLKAGKIRISPEEAIEVFKAEVKLDFMKMWHDPKLLGQILTLFIEE